MKAIHSRPPQTVHYAISRDFSQSTYTSITDEHLCELYRKTQRQDILLILLERYDRYIRLICQPFEAYIDSIEDFLSELYLLLHGSLLTSQPKVFKHWLGRVARNKLLDKQRKKNPMIVAEFPTCQSELAQKWDFDIDFELIKRAIQDLKPDQQFCVKLAYLQAYKPKEIQELLGWSSNTYRKVRQNALRNLRQSLSRYRPT